MIPNKVYQSLACGRPTITRSSDAYGDELAAGQKGLFFVPPADPGALAQKVSELLADPSQLKQHGRDAYEVFTTHYALASLKTDLDHALKTVLSL